MEQIQGRKNKFADWSDSDSEYEIDDQDINKILIVTQTPPYMRKHLGGDRTGNHVCHAKITSELAKVINDGLYYYEQDLWTEQSENDTIMKVTLFIFDLKTTIPVLTVPKLISAICYVIIKRYIFKKEKCQ